MTGADHARSRIKARDLRSQAKRKDVPSQGLARFSTRADVNTINSVGAVYTRMHRVMYLTDAATVTGHFLYVDGSSHFGRW
jgi:hypothetical protein